MKKKFLLEKHCLGPKLYLKFYTHTIYDFQFHFEHIIIDSR